MEQNKDLCEVRHVHKETIDHTLANMPSEEEMLTLADCFKILSDTTRLKIVLALLENELCVCDICHVVSLSQSAVSHQLRVLRAARLAKYRKEGKMVFYSIDDDHVASIIKQAIEHISHTHIAFK
ncbi:metalloregulator ArsR/SmtB family transcription factor [Paludicola sp. MB14-C6]|uniref:ArsR/SmtB family transcription factor n=1 Tax=Paludihabitans sp. MB14-C6 TaxID=3070656 RepID=UPI0027DC4AD6|nr:metalloregulator ArsR/SmtB family transcription factor [Paludicola sp. MB14-C6]WMJ22437.1 metalloregulator ArsR/SmtB family transcription factor [Paludicola sp. MB14-C6]